MAGGRAAGCAKGREERTNLAVSEGNMTFANVFILYASHELTVKKPNVIFVADQ
jgi:hypothetical protein